MPLWQTVNAARWPLFFSYNGLKETIDQYYSVYRFKVGSIKNFVYPSAVIKG